MALKYSWIKVQRLKDVQPKRRFTELWEKIFKDSFRLDSLWAIHRGLWTGALYVFIVPQDIVKEYSLEKEALKPAIRGRDIRAFGYLWKGFYVIYASKEHIPDFEIRFPNVMRWLSKHKTILERRAAVFTWGKKWWELEDPLDPRVFEIPKILSPLFSRQQNFAIDTNNYYVLDSTTIIRPWLTEDEQIAYARNWNQKNNPPIDVDEFLDMRKQYFINFKDVASALKYTLALLNAEVLEFIFKQYSPMLAKRTKRPKKGRWYSYMPPYLNILPIKLGTRSQQAEILSITDKLVETTMRYLRSDHDSSNMSALEAEIGLLSHKLNEIVFDIYNLDDKERIIIQNFVYQKR